MPGSIKVALVDDHMVVHDGIRAMTERTPDLHFMWAASSGEELLAKLQHEVPDVLLLDLRLGSENGFALCKRVRRERPAICILIFTAFGDLELLQASVHAGASGYVLKDVSTQGLPEIIRHAFREGSYFDPRLAGKVVLETFGGPATAAPRRLLSEREIEIIRLIAEGKANREIATLLHLSPHTIKFHISKLMRDFGVSRRAELVRIAFDRHLL